jgi:hypothetical protein
MTTKRKTPEEKMTPEQVSKHRTLSMIKYMNRTTIWLKPHIDNQLSRITKSVYLNIQEFDDRLYEALADNTELCDGRRRWVDLYRPARIRIVRRYLINKKGYKQWSGRTNKILYKETKPAKKSKPVE